MHRYFIESPHRAEDCTLLMKNVLAMGYLMHFNWGCKSDIHVGWAIIEAEDEAQASLVVPPMVRSQARILRVDRWGPEDFRE